MYGSLDAYLSKPTDRKTYVLCFKRTSTTIPKRKKEAVRLRIMGLQVRV